jgi:hypothetical protein
VSVTANGVITKATTVGIKNWFQDRTIALVLLRAGEQALIFFNQQHDDHQAQYKKRQRQECREDGSPGTAGSGGHVHKVLEAAWHLALGGLVMVDGYVRQEEAGDEVVNVQA